MRRRVSRVAIVAVAVALVLLAVPFAVGIRISFFSDERTELERAALAAAVRVGPDFAAGDPVELPPPSTDGQVAVYDRALNRRDGSGPQTGDTATRHALAGVITQGTSAGELVVAVPVTTSERVVGVVRASSPVQSVWNRVLLAWLALTGAALLALGAGVLIAVRQARALSRPLESLAGVARSVAAGDLSARAAGSGIPEIDDAAKAQNVMVDRLTAVLDHERHFAADASHQLRTPLAGLQLSLESAVQDPTADLRAALEDALRQSGQLQQTVEQVLALSRLESQRPQTDRLGTVGELLSDLRHRWHSPLADQGRRIEFVVTDSAHLKVPLNACQQIVGILVDNARVHGHGTVRVTARDTLGAVAIEVADEGSITGTADVFQRGVSRQARPGIGLGLARDLAESQGGRLTLVRAGPATFGLLMPEAGDNQEV
jgi:signal transduction histidine kinase